MRDLSQSATWRLAFDHAPGSTFNYAPRGPIEKTANAIIIHPPYSVYVPTDEDLEILRRAFPTSDPEEPNWSAVEAELIVNGHRRDDIVWHNAATLIRLLNTGVASSTKDDPVNLAPKTESTNALAHKFTRPVLIAQAAEALNTRADYVKGKLERANKPIGGTTRRFIAELDDLIELYPRSKRILKTWADKNYPEA